MTADTGREMGDLYIVPRRDQGRRISPTIISQYVRLDQCRRYLRLALHERAFGSQFLADYGVSPQPILPLLTRSGAEFESKVETAAAQQFPTRNLADERDGSEREYDNDEIVDAVRSLSAGEVTLLFQPRLRVTLDGWDFTGVADIVRLERGRDGAPRLVIADIKATTTAKVEHRLQVAFYREMLRHLLAGAGIEDITLEMGILYRGGTGAPDESIEPADAERLAAEREAAARLFGIEDAQFESTPHPAAYIDAARSLVLAPDSVAARACDTQFDTIPWHLSYKCDGCLYNEFCMKWAAEHDDLSLLPHLTEHDKTGLINTGVTTTRDLAALLEPAPDPVSGTPDLRTLRPAPGREETARRVARTWPVGPRLDEIVHRARRYRGWQGDDTTWLPYIPSKGYGSLPYSDADHNPNLVRIYIDAQHDYLLDRLYLIGSLVVGNEGGVPVAHRRRTVVEITPGPPDESTEREMLVRWIDGTIRALAEVAAPDALGNLSAPIHLIFYNGFEQRLLLQALSRHAREILAATPLYDFMTQLAAFDSQIATFLDQEIREHKNYPIVCQSLQAVAAMAQPGGVRFDWNEPEPYRDIFRERMFDALGKFDSLADADGRIPWSTRRSRFNSQIPLEYAYAAWGILAETTTEDGDDPYQPYRAATVPLLVGFQARRLEALQHVANDFPGNRDTTKTNFTIPDLSRFDGKARDLASALQEFVTIERHVDLAAWKSARLAPPERRVLSGDTLIVRYLESDQTPELLDIVAENLRRAALREAFRQEYFATHPNAKSARLTREQKALTEPIPLNAPYKLRLDIQDCGISLDDALALSTLKEGDRVVVEPRWTVDSRLPEEEQKPLTPTPKQLLYGMRMVIEDIEIERDDSGHATRAWLLVNHRPSFGSNSPPGYLFSGFDEQFKDGEQYTIDPDPNDIYGFWGAKVVAGLVDGNRNTLFQRARDGGAGAVNWPAAAAAGQSRFMAGLEAMCRAGLGNAFEPSKVAYIGDSGDSPLLLVQGPPGTGKSYTTAFAVFARVQGALAAGIPYRVVIGAKTHAATNVLLANIINARRNLAEVRDRAPALFAEYFDDRLLNVPLYRVQPRDDVPAEVTPLRTGQQRPDGQPKVMELLADTRVAIVASTPGGIYAAANDGPGNLFSHQLVELLVLDEASQLSLPESIMAALPLKTDGQVVIVGDHRQMAPIVKHDWENETRRTFQEYAVYRSLFDTILRGQHRLIQFEQSFRLDRDMAEFLRRAIYAGDGLDFHSTRDGRLRVADHADDFVTAALDPAYPLVVIVHDEASSQLRNDFERDLAAPILEALHGAGYRIQDGFGLVVPHRAQRANLQETLRRLLAGAEDPDALALAVDTVERFQGGERDAIVVSATESDPAYLLAAGKFLYDPRRLTVAISRARDKMILIAGRSVFSLFSPDEETFANAQLWKDLWHRTCTVPLWCGEKEGRRVEVWGNPPLVELDA